ISDVEHLGPRPLDGATGSNGATQPLDRRRRPDGNDVDVVSGAPPVRHLHVDLLRNAVARLDVPVAEVGDPHPGGEYRSAARYNSAVDRDGPLDPTTLRVLQ